MISADILLEQFGWDRPQQVALSHDPKHGPFYQLKRMKPLQRLPDADDFYGALCDLDTEDQGAVKYFLKRFGPLTRPQRKTGRLHAGELKEEQKKAKQGKTRPEDIHLVSLNTKRLTVMPAGLIDYMRLLWLYGDEVRERCLNPECNRRLPPHKNKGAKYCNQQCANRYHYVVDRLLKEMYGDKWKQAKKEGRLVADPDDFDVVDDNQ